MTIQEAAEKFSKYKPEQEMYVTDVTHYESLMRAAGYEWVKVDEKESQNPVKDAHLDADNRKTSELLPGTDIKKLMINIPNNQKRPKLPSKVDWLSLIFILFTLIAVVFLWLSS